MAEIFNVDAFQQKLKASNIGKRIIYSDVTGSTMDDARKLGVSNPEEYPHGTVVMAERQTKARGARDHKWDASNTGNIYVSIILHMPPHFKTFEGRFDLEVASCMAVFKVVRSLGVDAVPKWPNDLWVRGHKLAGFLVEDSRFDIPDSNLCLVILGLGINVNADVCRNPDLYSIATSLLCQRSGNPVCREDFFSDVCFALEETLLSRSDNLTKFCSHNLFQEGREISITCPSENRVIDGEFVEVCENWEIKFTDRRTKETLQGRSDYYTIRPKVCSRILVAFSGINASKSASVVASRLTSIVDTSRHVVCSVPESAITQSEEWMKTCDLLVLAEDVCDSVRLTSKLMTYLKMGGNLFAMSVASYFTAKIFGIPFKEGVLESLAANIDVSVISVECECGAVENGDMTVPSRSHITFPTSLIYFKFSMDYAVKDFISGMQKQSVNRDSDFCEKHSESSPQKSHIALKYFPCEEQNKYCLAILTRPTTHGGCIALFGFDLGVDPTPFSSIQGTTEGATDAEKMVKEAEKDRFKRDQLLYRVLNILDIY